MYNACRVLVEFRVLLRRYIQKNRLKNSLSPISKSVFFPRHHDFNHFIKVYFRVGLLVSFFMRKENDILFVCACVFVFSYLHVYVDTTRVRYSFQEMLCIFCMGNQNKRLLHFLPAYQTNLFLYIFRLCAFLLLNNCIYIFAT